MAFLEALSSNSVVWKKEKKIGRRFPETGRSQSNWAAQQTENKTQDSFSPSAVDKQSVPSATRAMTSISHEDSKR